VRRGDVVCDIGANRGYFTQLFSDLAGSEGHVHAFEPGPEAVEMLRAGLAAARGYDNVTLVEAALADAEGTMELLTPDGVDGQSSLRRQRSGAWNGAREVRRRECRVLTLDACARDFTRLDFIKCDIEGAELAALRGARDTLRRFMPLVFVEVFEEWMRPFGCQPADLISYLRELGYDEFQVAGEKLGPLECADFSQTTNLLCAQRARHAARLTCLERL
jgi:FkbM family methyltransferase